MSATLAALVQQNDSYWSDRARVICAQSAADDTITMSAVSAPVRRHRRTPLVMIALVLVGLICGTVSAIQAPPAQASVSYGNAGLNWAEAHAAGHWYGWGGIGPAVFDCSGLVYASMRAVDPHWPSTVRTTYAMIAYLAGHQIPVSQARRGDLLFFGSGHVEYATIWHHTSFGAQQTGTKVWWHPWSGWWAPTMAFRV